jgi:hypothetical protein
MADGEERLNEETARGSERAGEPSKAPRTRGPRTSRFAKDSSDVLGGERYTAERETEEREQTENREFSDDERFEMFVDSHGQSVMPDLPQMDGFHTCWLTTTNPRDTIARRRMMGYQLIRAEEIPGWAGLSMKTGEFAGVISVNEMVAARISLRLYNRYMKHSHEALPRSEEEKLRANVDLMKQQAESAGGKIFEGDGTEQIVQRAPPMPEFRA